MRFNALKKKNPALKTLLAVGGWTHEEMDSPFSKMVATAAGMKAFTDSSIACLRKFLTGFGLGIPGYEGRISQE